MNFCSPLTKCELSRKGVLISMGTEWKCRNMNTLEALSTHFYIVLINSILKGNNKCTHYPVVNANGLEVQENLSHNT